jgi:hypothetical protein
LLAAIGFGAVFAGATNTPLACTGDGRGTVRCRPDRARRHRLHRQLHGRRRAGHHGSQRVDTTKVTGREHGSDSDTLHAIVRRRRLWLPARPMDGEEAAG